VIFAIGSVDRVFYRLHISHTALIHFWRAGVWILPIVVFVATWRACLALQRSRAHPLRASQEAVIPRRPDGTVEVLAESRDRLELPPTEEPVGTMPGRDSG